MHKILALMLVPAALSPASASFRKTCASLLRAAAALLLFASFALPATSDRFTVTGPDWSMDRQTITDPTLPRVLLVGDSILNGYGGQAITMLAGKANVDKWVQGYNHNYMDTTYPVWVEEILANGPYDIIMFNNGLHGVGLESDGQYVDPAQFPRLAAKMVKAFRDYGRGARLVWLNTTPMTLKDISNPRQLKEPENTTINLHNSMSKKVMDREVVPIIDLYSLMTNPISNLEFMSSDGVHWTDPGWQILATAVSNDILANIPSASFSPGSADYAGAQSVTITAMISSATIRYTTDGSDPTSSSQVVNGPISIAATTTLKARSFVNGVAHPVGTAVFTITGNVVDRTNGGGTPEARGASKAEEDSSHAFDNLRITKWFEAGAVPTATAPTWLGFIFPNDLRYAITRYTIRNADAPWRNPRSWKLKGSNDGNWSTAQVLHEVTEATFDHAFNKKTYDFVNTTAYNRYRLEITACGDERGQAAISEMELFTIEGAPAASAPRRAR